MRNIQSVPEVTRLELAANCCHAAPYMLLLTVDRIAIASKPSSVWGYQILDTLNAETWNETRKGPRNHVDSFRSKIVHIDSNSSTLMIKQSQP